MIFSAVFTILDSQQDRSCSFRNFSWWKDICSSHIASFCFYGPKTLQLYPEHMPVPCCFLQPLSEVQERTVERLGQSLPLCLVGIMIHLMLSTCMIAGGLLATRLDIMNSVSHFCHKSQRQSLTYTPQNCFYRRSFHLWHQSAQRAYV